MAQPKKPFADALGDLLEQYQEADRGEMIADLEGALDGLKHELNEDEGDDT